MRAILWAGILALVPLGPVLAAGDGKAGAAIAETWCRPCHATTGGRAADSLPSFGEIATKRSAQSIAAFLADPHGAMPNIQLSRRQIDDVVAYIETLKSR